MMGEIFLNFLSAASLRDEAIGRSLVQSLLEHVPSIAPARFGEVEPLTQVFTDDSIGRFAELWGEDLFWEHKKNGVFGSVMHSFGRDHTSCVLHFPCGLVSLAALVDFFRVASVILDVDYSSAHLFPSPDSRKIPSGVDDYFRELQTYHLEKWLPNVPWAACYGRPYVELFGLDKLLSSPAFRAELLWERLVYCQVSQDIQDVLSRPKDFEEVRARVREHLGSDAFLGPESPIKACRAARFVYS